MSVPIAIAALPPTPSRRSSRGGKHSRQQSFEEILDNDETVDLSYTGGDFPSKTFKYLQQSIGEQTNEPQNGTFGLQVYGAFVPT